MLPSCGGSDGGSALAGRCGGGADQKSTCYEFWRGVSREQRRRREHVSVKFRSARWGTLPVLTGFSLPLTH